MTTRVLSKRRYIAAKVLATFLSLIFAFLYSQDLGYERRSILVYAFTLSSLIWIMLTSGSTLTLRKLKANNSESNFGSFIALILVETFVGLLVLAIGLTIFSNYKTIIPTPLIFLIYAYFLLSGLAMIMVEVLISYLQYLFSGYLELMAVGIQVFLFFLVLKPFDLSIAVRLLLSFNISYLIICVWMVKAILSSMEEPFRIASPVTFLKATKGSHLIGVSLGIVDRIDRIIIAFYFPTGTLAKYSVMSSLIAYFRFIPEFFSRIMISGFSLALVVSRKMNVLFSILFTLILAFIIAGSRILISSFLGSDWLLPVAIFVAFGVQEILRGVYQLSLNYNSKLNLSHSTTIIPVVLLVFVAIFTSLLVHPLGLIGIPVAFSLAFCVAILLAYLWRQNV